MSAEKEKAQKAMEILDLQDRFEYLYDQYFNQDDNSSPRRVLNKPIKKASEAVQSRILNHWEEVGIIDDPRPKGKGWRQYSIVQGLWIFIVMELRKFNYPLEKILKIKHYLIKDHEKHEHSFMPLLEFVTFQLMTYRIPSYLVVSSDETVFIGSRREVNLQEEFNFISTHISINLNKTLANAFPTLNVNLEFEIDWELSQAEQDLLFDIRSGKYEEFAIKSESGNIRNVKITEVIRDKNLFKDLSLDHKYQDVTIQIRNSKKTAIKRSILRKY